MTRSKIAAFLTLAFIVLFCFAGVTATTTVKDATVSIEMGLPKLLFSLSSGPILLIPLTLIAAAAAFIAFIQDEKNVGMLFSLVATVCFGLFMVFFAMEEKNSALYTPIAEALDACKILGGIGTAFAHQGVQGKIIDAKLPQLLSPIRDGIYVFWRDHA